MGTFICDSTMGISALDIFTDILISISDLKKFIFNFNINPSDNPTALAIQVLH